MLWVGQPQPMNMAKITMNRTIRGSSMFHMETSLSSSTTMASSDFICSSVRPFRASCSERAMGPKFFLLRAMTGIRTSARIA